MGRQVHLFSTVRHKIMNKTWNVNDVTQIPLNHFYPVQCMLIVWNVNTSRLKRRVGLFELFVLWPPSMTVICCINKFSPTLTTKGFNQNSWTGSKSCNSVLFLLFIMHCAWFLGLQNELNNIWRLRKTNLGIEEYTVVISRLYKQVCPSIWVASHEVPQACRSLS